VFAELAVGDNINAFDIESFFFGNKYCKIKMPWRDRTEKKKQVELNEATTGTKTIKKFLCTAASTESEPSMWRFKVSLSLFTSYDI